MQTDFKTIQTWLQPDLKPISSWIRSVSTSISNPFPNAWNTLQSIAFMILCFVSVLKAFVFCWSNLRLGAFLLGMVWVPWFRFAGFCEMQQNAESHQKLGTHVSQANFVKNHLSPQRFPVASTINQVCVSSEPGAVSSTGAVSLVWSSPLLIWMKASSDSSGYCAASSASSVETASTPLALRRPTLGEKS